MENRWKIGLLAFISFFVSTSEYVIAGILDKIAAWVHVSVSTAGQLITVCAIANAIGSPLFVMATAAMNRRNLLILSLALVMVGCAMTVLLPGFDWLLLSRIVLAIGGGVFVIGAKTVAAALAPPGRQANAIATVLTGFSAALIVGVPIGRVMAVAWGWPVIFLGIGVLSLLAVGTVWFAIPTMEGETPVPLRRQLALLRNRNILSGFAITFFWQFGYAMLYAYIAPYLLNVTSVSERSVSTVLLAFGIATLLGSKFGGFVTERIGIPRSLIGSMTLQAIALVLLSMFTGSAFVTTLLLLLWGFSAWASGPGLQFHLIDHAPAAAGILLSLYGSILQLSIAAAGSIGGMAVQNLSVRAVPWIAALSVVLGVGLAAGSFLYGSRRKTDEGVKEYGN
ncbi:MAG: MFS transporter [Alicyclobacillus mali]|uniref:MFS transporter n=1 Tax=Alicyclobacillus mali (ex Roth et al. 2021) TaxID=1123961 RepID=UPI0023F32CF1|nr:MFS transporter [Alicyclobacillus mali (ex Roth et al. 2021)]MCL6489669.1 MFS transporter [Alicyclobacillus mali (ex Roth et al. 2021)]